MKMQAKPSPILHHKQLWDEENVHNVDLDDAKLEVFGRYHTGKTETRQRKKRCFNFSLDSSHGRERTADELYDVQRSTSVHGQQF